MDAGDDPLRPLRPEERDEKPKPAESQDDGYETSNSGDPVQRRKPSSAEGSPAAPAPTVPAPAITAAGVDAQSPSPAPLTPAHSAPAPPDLPPPPPDPPYETMLRYHQPDPEPYRHFDQPASLSQPEPQYFPFPKYNDAYSYKRDDLPYDMTQHHHQQPLQQHQHHPQYAHTQHQKRDDDIYNGIKRECEDPYSFVEDEAMCVMLQQQQSQQLHGTHQLNPDHHQHMMQQHHLMLNQPKKRGRKKKIKDENGMEIKADGSIEGALCPRPVKERKKHDRFNGMSEEEVSRRTLPDHLAENLDIIIIGINPGLFAAYKGHHYAGPGNHFWKCLYLSGLTREQMSADEDYKLLNFGIGFTNMVPRPTKGSADLTRREIKEGSAVLLEKLQTFRPKVAVFNGKLIYEVFSGKKDFCFGKQPDTIAGTNTYMWVMPSSSARCAQLPRAADKVPFYAALKKFRDYLNGLVAHLDEAELVFPDTTSRRPQDEMEIRRLTMEPEPGDTIILEDGTEVPLKKKRGRPKKVKLENGEVVPPTPRAPRQPRPPPSLEQVGDQPPKKKRGRPKKIRPEDQQFLMQQQAQQQSGNPLSQSGLSVGGEQGYLPPHQGEFPHQLPSPGSLLYHHTSLTDNSTPSYFQQQTQPQAPQPASGMDSPLDVSGALGLSRGYGSPGGGSVSGGGATVGGGTGGVNNPATGFCSSPRGVYASPVSQGYSPGGGTPGPSFPGSPGAVGSGVGGAGPVGYHSPAARASFSGRSPLYAHSPAHQPYHHHHHLQTQQSSPASAQNRFSQSPHPHHPLPYSRSPAPQTQSRPYSRSPVGAGGSSTPFPAASPAGAGAGTGTGGYTPSPAHTPYSHRSSPAPAARTPVYTDAHHFAHQGGGSFGGELSQEIGAAISSPGDMGPVSPGMPPLDFEPPRHPDRAPSPDLHPASTSDSSLSEYNKQPLSCEQTPVGGELSPGGVGVGGVGGVGTSPFNALYDAEVRLGYTQTLHHTHSPAPHDPYRNDQGNGMADSPRLDQLHQHPSMYPSNFNRSTPPGGAEGPFSPLSNAAFRPHTPQPPHTPHTPHTPLHHQPGSPGEFSGAVKTKSQDVASKSLSGLESLVDQIPSIAEGPGGAAGVAGAGVQQVVTSATAGGGGVGGGEQQSAPATVTALPEYAPALYGPYGAYGGAAYGNNGYGTPFVGYGGGWGATVMRPAPGYLPDWQYGYPPSAYAPYNTPYYNGYAAPPPAHHQQTHYLSAPPLLDLHKNSEHPGGVPSVPSVGFGGFC